MSFAKLLAVAAALGAAEIAQAHVIVQPKTAVPGTEQTLRFVVGHGCNGQPTTGLRVDLPRGVEQVEPQPKPGWSVAIEKSDMGTVNLVWSAGSFPPHQHDGFDVKVKLPARSGTLAFPAYQFCGTTVVGWTETQTPLLPKPPHPVPHLTLAEPGR